MKKIAESGITILGACREEKEGKLLDRFFWTLEKVTLKKMSDKEIKEIIRQQVYPVGSEPAISFKDKEAQLYFVERTIKNAKGIPLRFLVESSMTRPKIGSGVV